METLYHQTNKLVQETQYLFSQLEKKPPNLEVVEIEQEIESKIQTINRYLLLMLTFMKYFFFFLNSASTI